MLCLPSWSFQSRGGAGSCARLLTSPSWLLCLPAARDWASRLPSSPVPWAHPIGPQFPLHSASLTSLFLPLIYVLYGTICELLISYSEFSYGSYSLGMQQNHLEGLLKHKFLGPIHKHLLQQCSEFAFQTSFQGYWKLMNLIRGLHWENHCHSFSY